MRAKPIFIMLCLAAVLAPFVPAGRGRPSRQGFPGWPATFEGRTLVRVKLPSREARFAAGFPGRIGAFTDGSRLVLVRWVPRPTRLLHPAEDCYRGLGFAITPRPILRDDGGARWETFIAERDGEKLVVRERICDESGGQWTDTSSWYWAALLGRTRGPWWAYTVAELE